MEDENLLNVDNDLHIFCLHFVFIPRINAAIQQFLESWNNHPLSSAHNMSPIQLWIVGLSASLNDRIEVAIIIFERLARGHSQ